MSSGFYQEFLPEKSEICNTDIFRVSLSTRSKNIEMREKLKKPLIETKSRRKQRQ